MPWQTARKLQLEIGTLRINSDPLLVLVLATRTGNAPGTTHRWEEHESVVSGITAMLTNVASVVAYDGCAERTTKQPVSNLRARLEK